MTPSGSRYDLIQQNNADARFRAAAEEALEQLEALRTYHEQKGWNSTETVQRVTRAIVHQAERLCQGGGRGAVRCREDRDLIGAKREFPPQIPVVLGVTESDAARGFRRVDTCIPLECTQRLGLPLPVERGLLAHCAGILPENCHIASSLAEMTTTG
jgi:hypothetical protein